MSMPGQQEFDARTLEREILAAIDKYEKKTGVAVTGFSRDIVWDYDHSSGRRSILTTGLSVAYETRMGG